MNNIPMTTTTLLTGVPEFVGSELGAAALRRAYSDAGLHSDTRSAVGRYLPEASIAGLLDSAARQAGNDELGALLGNHMNFGIYDTWGPYILEAKTLGESLGRFSTVARFLASHSTGGTVVRGKQTQLNYRWGTRSSVGYRQVCLATAGSLLNTLRLYLGPTFLPDEIHLDISRQRRTSFIETYLPTRIFFDADQISLRFPKALLQTKRIAPLTARPITLSDVRRRVLTGPPRDIDTIMEELIRVQIVNGGPNFDQFCRALNMNCRTLRRKLDRSGEGFRDKSSRIRLEIAEELLRETDMSVHAVADAVGYSDPYNFSRAFNNHYGFRPTAVRNF